MTSAAPAVDDDALPGEEARGLRRDEAHRVRDGARVGAGTSALVAGTSAGSDRVDRDPERRERPRPAADQADLGALGRRVGGPAGRQRSSTSASTCTIRPDRRAVMPGSSARPSSTGRLTNSSSWATWSSHATAASGASGCGSGGAQDEHLDRAEAVGDRGGELRPTCASSVTSALNASATPPSSRMAPTTSGGAGRRRR